MYSRNPWAGFVLPLASAIEPYRWVTIIFT